MRQCDEYIATSTIFPLLVLVLLFGACSNHAQAKPKTEAKGTGRTVKKVRDKEYKPKVGPITDPNDPNLLEQRAYDRYRSEKGNSTSPIPSHFSPTEPVPVNTLAKFEGIVNSAYSAYMDRDRKLLKLAKLSGKDNELAEVLFDMYSSGRGKKAVERYAPQIEQLFPKSAELWKILKLTFESYGDSEAAAACSRYPDNSN